MHFTIIPFAADLALPLGPYSHISCRLYVTIHCFVFEKFIAISCYFTFASTRNIWLSAVWLSATPIISGNFQTHARRAHLSSDLILYACSNIHLSGSRHVQLTADILRPRHPANNQTLSVVVNAQALVLQLSLLCTCCFWVVCCHWAISLTTQGTQGTMAMNCQASNLSTRPAETFTVLGNSKELVCNYPEYGTGIG